MTLTFVPIQSSVTKTAVFTGTGVDVSGITADWTLKIQITSMTANNARFQFTDSVDGFVSDIVAGPSLDANGTYTPATDRVKSWKKQDFKSLRIGVASAKLRLDITRIDAGASVTYNAWIEY